MRSSSNRCVWAAKVAVTRTSPVKSCNPRVMRYVRFARLVDLPMMGFAGDLLSHLRNVRNIQHRQFPPSRSNPQCHTLTAAAPATAPRPSPVLSPKYGAVQ